MFRKIVFIILTLIGTNFISADEIKDALKLNERGSDFVSQFVKKDENQRIYANDKNYIEDFPLANYQVKDNPLQGKFYVDYINDTIKNQLRNGDVWELKIKQVIEANVKPGTVVLDIGSHIGTHTVTMSKCVGPQGKVIAFEPNKKIYRELCMNLAINQCDNVIPLRYALGKEQGSVQIETPLSVNEGGSYVIKEAGGSNTAAMIRLDDLKLANISFIKMDVENMEADVIEGAKETISRNRPIMVVEIQGNKQRPVLLGEDTNKMADESKRKIQSLGYRLEHLGGSEDYDYLALPIN